MNMRFKQHGFIWIEQILQDIRFSLRMLRKNPGFTAIAVISLALAIGVNSGVFSIVNAMLFKPIIPLRPNEVVNVYTKGTAVDSEYRPFWFDEYSLLRESDEVFTDVAAFHGATVGVGATTDSDVRRKLALVVSDNYFSLLGITPAMGRFFLPEESRLDANIPVAVVSRSLWESLGGGNDFSDRTVAINGDVYPIVGVVPERFSGTTAMVSFDVWLPIGMASRFVPSRILGGVLEDWLFVTARLQPGLTLEAAKARLPVVAARLTTIAVDADKGARTLEIQPPTRWSLSPAPSSDGPMRLGGAFLIGMAGVVLLVACLNLANMFLARNMTRFDELAVRLALGASRRRVVRILSVEGLIVALMGGGVGLVLSYWANGLLLGSLTHLFALSSSGVSISLDTAPDIRVLLATFLFCVIAMLVFAFAPAWRTTRDIAKGNFSFRHSTRTTTDRWGRLFSGRNCMLMAQLALSLTLLFIAGLYFAVAHSAARLDPGFEPEGDLVAEVDYTLVNRGNANVQPSISPLMDELRAHPDISKVVFASSLPFEGSAGATGVTTAGATGKPARSAIAVQTDVSSGYFDAMGIKLLRGRDFTDNEMGNFVIIDQGLAEELFTGEDPVGKYIRRDNPGAYEGPWFEIVGVVSAHLNDFGSEPLRIFFYAHPGYTRHFFVHVWGQTADAASSGDFRESVRSRLLNFDPDIPLMRLTPYTAIIEENLSLWALRFIAVLFGIFGVVALLLSVIGVYGVRAFFVERRMREIGIRIALGASRRRVYALLMKEAVVQIAISLCVGVMLSLGVGKLFSGMRQGVSPGGPVVLALAALILVLAALLATWVPARRAAKVDPMEVLRWE